MRPTHNGVLIPAEMDGASPADLDAYAEKVKAGNRAFVEAHFALERRAMELGVDLSEERRLHADGRAL